MSLSQSAIQSALPPLWPQLPDWPHFRHGPTDIFRFHFPFCPQYTQALDAVPLWLLIPYPILYLIAYLMYCARCALPCRAQVATLRPRVCLSCVVAQSPRSPFLPAPAGFTCTHFQGTTSAPNTPPHTPYPPPHIAPPCSSRAHESAAALEHSTQLLSRSKAPDYSPKALSRAAALSCCLGAQLVPWSTAPDRTSRLCCPIAQHPAAGYYSTVGGCCLHFQWMLQSSGRMRFQILSRYPFIWQTATRRSHL